ncbi:hypothetical protein BLNAU_14000 [Blattamonas nauphoetae]|uniref:Uncharacterized protein n=1 Tax=Blattamonas nauphoetae TaxID=2049346 RepID=A0ABQ9XJP0_9EUKA|nr:hypothetical protein BLNAU_14000 [Blattamonas nauphoetae]
MFPIRDSSFYMTDQPEITPPSKTEQVFDILPTQDKLRTDMVRSRDELATHLLDRTDHLPPAEVHDDPQPAPIPFEFPDMLPPIEKVKRGRPTKNQPADDA